MLPIFTMCFVTWRNASDPLTWKDFPTLFGLKVPTTGAISSATKQTSKGFRDVINAEADTLLLYDARGTICETLASLLPQKCNNFRAGKDWSAFSLDRLHRTNVDQLTT